MIELDASSEKTQRAKNRSALIRMFLVLRMAPGCYGILGPLCHAWPMKLK